MKVSFLIVILSVHLLLAFNGADADSCPPNLIADTNNTFRFPFNTSNFLCSSVWGDQGFILMYQQSSASVWSFVLSAPYNGAYIAIGFSSNGEMVGSSAIVGWLSSTGGGVAKQYFLGGKSPSQCLADQGNLQLAQPPILILESYRLYLGFQLNVTQQPTSQLIFSLGPQYFIPASDNYLVQHQASISASINYATGESSGNGNPWSTLQKVHGALSMGGWGVLLPIGVLMARYLKAFWDPAWVYAHGFVQVLAVSVGVGGVVTGFLLEKDVDVDVTPHKGLGLGVMSLAALQVILVLIRPKKGSTRRKYWNWYHHNAGRLAVAGAIANVFYGLALAKQDTSWFIGYGCYLGVIVLLALGLEIRKLVKKKDDTPK